jgi:tRNA (uracil-5-)-methyltransferase
MADTAQTGQTRPNPCSSSSSSSPIGKKPRLEKHAEAPVTDQVQGQSMAGTTLKGKKTTRKEARKAKKKGLHIPPEPYSTEDVLWRDVVAVLGQDVVDTAVNEGTEWDSPFEFREEVELIVHSLSSNGTRLQLC